MKTTKTLDEIEFSAHSQNYCVCIIDMVNSTLVTAQMINSNDIRKYYSIFINTMASMAKNFDGKMIKNSGDSVIIYFPFTSDSSNKNAFKKMLECCVTIAAANTVINEKLYESSLPPLKYRISADYGRVEIARSITSQVDDLFGPTVNLCAKINKKAEINGIIIGGDLFLLLKSMPSVLHDYQLRAAGEYPVGIKNSYPLYSVKSKYHKPTITNLMEIPLLKPNESFSRNTKTEDKSQTQSQTYRYRVMLVDDDEDILSTFHAILTSQGIVVESYIDSLEALNHFALADLNFYNLVILDIRMPNLNGLQLYYRLRAIKKDIRILFLSALDASEELISILPDVQLNNIIKKPVQRDFFISAIKTVLSNGKIVSNQ